MQRGTCHHARAWFLSLHRPSRCRTYPSRHRCELINQCSLQQPARTSPQGLAPPPGNGQRCQAAMQGSSVAHIQNQSAVTVGVVIVDHGSRKAESNDMLVEFAELYRQVTGRAIVEVAHMEIAEPTIEQAVNRCVQRGATKVIVAPYFLSRGRHIQQDIPALVADARQQLPPGVECIIAEPIGIDALMAQLIEHRVAAAERGQRS